MKKLFKTFISLAVAAVLCANFAACSLGGTTDDTVYTIQYADDEGTHKIEVKNGDLYSLESIPEKLGYTFLGLYDSEEGGTQYVNAGGSSLSAFSDGKNLVLYPQYKANEYTVVLDYGEAAVTGSRQYTVSYGSSLPDLPTNLLVEHKTFSGWYTEENCGGTKVADNYGLIPVVSVVSEDNFDITDSTAYIYLYAGFTTQTYTVTFNFGSGISSETVEVEYGTDISSIVPSTRNSDGFAVLSWSLYSGGSEYTGTVTDDIQLYALEWAPCIDFNSNGGDSVTSIVAKAGSSIILPAATRQSYKFMYWADSDGNESQLSVMPEASVTLKAVWQAMITFDENGGTEVDDISEAAGTEITLPTPEKDGYIFAGWYASDKTQYTAAKMPSASVELKAGWYAELTDTVIEISSTSYNSDNRHAPSTSYLCFAFDYSNYFNDNAYHYVTININVNLKTSASSEKIAYVDFYSQKTISSIYLMKTITFTNVTNSYKSYSASATFNIADDFYMCFYDNSANLVNLYLQDFYYTVYYPDITTLYL